MAKIKSNDEVVVISGKDKGRRGKVLKVIPETGKVLVSGINIVKKHVRPNPQKSVCAALPKPTCLGCSATIQVVYQADYMRAMGGV